MEDAIRNGGGQSAVGRFIDLRQHERRIDGKECRQSWITMSGSRTAFIRCHPDLPSEERPRLDWATVNVQIPHKASAPPSDSQGQSALRPGACRRRRYAIEAV